MVMAVRPTLKLMLAAAAVTVAWPVHAREGNVGRGADIARSICAACHVVAGTVCRAEQPSAAVSHDREYARGDEHRPDCGFDDIASIDADIVLEPEERRDVIAYILSLR